MELNLEYARKAEGAYYGDGAALLAEKVARAAADHADTKDRAAAALGAIREFAKETGHNPDIECFMRPEYGGWRVCYEAGPYAWAIVASEALCQLRVFAEPNYNFDLVFYDE